jgi:hypothetical protein
MIPRFTPIHGGMGSVVGAQFGEDVPDLALDGFFADRELRCNLFVCIAFGNQTQPTDFCWGKGIVGGMLGKLVGGLPAWTARIVSNSSVTSPVTGNPLLTAISLCFRVDLAPIHLAGSE